MSSTGLRPWVGVALFLLAEAALYLSYRHHDARFHWFLHLFVGASAALLIMSIVAWRHARAVPLPLLWILVGHVYAMFPDILFFLFSILHRPWMDVFLWHIGGHFLAGRNASWYAIFLAALALYLAAIRDHPPQSE